MTNQPMIIVVRARGNRGCITIEFSIIAQVIIEMRALCLV